MIPNRTKIVCTLGPSSKTREKILSLVRAGMNVARLNFSHGNHASHQSLIEILREVAAAEQTQLTVMMDLQGPKLRIGRFAGNGAAGGILLKPGKTFTITSREVPGDETIVSTSYPGLPIDVSVGETVLIDDGFIELVVRSKTATDLVCEVVTGGRLSNNKGINVPNSELSLSTLTPKDLADIDFGVAQGVDYIALSFVRQPADVLQLREYLESKDVSVPVVSKIEKPEAVNQIDGIIAVSDGIMVARGDLGVELPAEDVPLAQKMIITKCNQAGVPVITATQMLDSMVNNPRPTRAESSDVANAIIDGSDAVMLSAESASGKYPLEAVKTMRRIIQVTEERSPRIVERRIARRFAATTLPTNVGIALAACTLSEQVDVRAIVCITLSGSMARSIAKYRPSVPIYAISQRPHELRRLCLVWGIEGHWMEDFTKNIDDTVHAVEEMLKARGRLKSGDRFVLTAGLPFAERKATNMVRVDMVP